MITAIDNACIFNLDGDLGIGWSYVVVFMFNNSLSVDYQIARSHKNAKVNCKSLPKMLGSNYLVFIRHYRVDATLAFYPKLHLSLHFERTSFPDCSKIPGE